MPGDNRVLAACVAVAVGVALPACGEGGATAEQERAADAVPQERVDQLDRRVSGVEEELKRLRKELEERNEQRSGDGADDSPSASGEPSGASGTGAGAGTTSGPAPGSGSGAGAGSGGASGARGDAGAGPDPGTAEDDRSVYDICGPNPAPNC